ncbi:Ubiquitin family protein [Histomonas meleagridis]|uniref:Ubiquitin family protein n=1 Tax=Histomonas meleagridis TaxID=135588 RepID=UPI00355A7018|nr:Ubiquitin family protein [Histomonas meleagridis]KAH0804843.1 Ubiquitin family protein [Histomonas meleagridis]
MYDTLTLDDYDYYGQCHTIYLITNLQQQFPITIVRILNQRINVNISFFDTIYDIKEKLFQQRLYPIEDQRILIPSAQCDNLSLACEFIYPFKEVYFLLRNDPIPFFTDKPNSFPIIVKTLDGKCYTFYVTSDEKVIELKGRTAFIQGYPPQDHRLAHFGRQLENEQTLGECNVVSGSIIYVFQRLRGGKPVIYIYPKERIDVNVKVNIKGKFTCTYPKYNTETGWNVSVNENGTMTNKDNPNSIQYDSLFWECLFDDEVQFMFDEGFIVTKESAATFLEEKLLYLGLRGKELTGFIQFWLPKIQRSNRTMVKFLSKEYEEVAKLDVTPRPDCVIRVFMIMMNLCDGCNAVELKEQNLETLHKERSGYTVVEWGGTIICEGSDK